MPSREEIGARIRSAIDLAQGYAEGCCPIDDITDSLIAELNSQGVVIKVGEDEIEAVDNFGASYKAKVVAVELLIKEG